MIKITQISLQYILSLLRTQESFEFSTTSHRISFFSSDIFVQASRVWNKKIARWEREFKKHCSISSFLSFYEWSMSHLSICSPTRVTWLVCAYKSLLLGEYLPWAWSSPSSAIELNSIPKTRTTTGINRSKKVKNQKAFLFRGSLNPESRAN